MDVSGPRSGRKAEAAALCVAVAVVFFPGVPAQPTTLSLTGPTRSGPDSAIVPGPVPDLPVNRRSEVYLDKTPPRQVIGLRLMRNNWIYDCRDCHNLLAARWHYDRGVKEHADVQLDHGNNRFCLNCHHPTDRKAFVDYDGSEIAEADVVQVCAKCHGTVYRDWQAGVHGRQNGFWKVSLGQKTKLRCIQCHDPHSPRFKSMAPLRPLRYPPRAAHPPVPLSGSHEFDPSSR